MKRVYLLAAGVLAMVFFCTGLQSRAMDSSVVYIYLSDITTANSYSLLLEANGFPTDLIPMSDIGITDLSKYNLIIIGPDTGNLNTWGVEDTVTTIYKSDIPIIGLGNGGYSFFGKILLYSGYSNGWYGHEDSVFISDVNRTFCDYPNVITIPEDKIIQLYYDTNHIGIYLNGIPPNVEVIGREVSNNTHFPLIMEEERFFLWGFDASPEQMTQIGKDIFINVVSYFF